MANAQYLLDVIFQFTPLREGRRRYQRRHARQRRISIHAPPRGATPVGMAILPPKLFQFTPLREGRHCCATNIAKVKISIHAPPRGATNTSKIFSRIILFQFTPLREGRRIPVDTHSIEKDFNSRPSARGDAKREPWSEP